MKHKHPTQLPPYSPAPIRIVMAADGNMPPLPRFDVLRRPLRHLKELAKTLTGWEPHPGAAAPERVLRDMLAKNAEGICLSYLSTGDAKGRRMVFIHGSPGYAAEWQPFLENCPSDQLRIAVDRPGYGDSLPAEALPSVTAQARAIAPLLEPDCILVGYSFGGPVALQLALDLPDLVAGIVLVGCPADPTLEYVHPIQRIAASPVIKRLMPQHLNSSNFELIPFKANLLAIDARLAEIKAHITILQGRRDTMVPDTNADYLVKKLQGPAAPRLILLPDGDHYLPWTHRDTIDQAIEYTIRDCG